MKCKKCQYQNASQANYCYACGQEFTKEEQKKAREKSFWYKLAKLKDRYDTITLSKITGSKAFQIGTIIGTILIGGYFILQNGYQFQLKESDAYTYEYNTLDKEYYVYLKERESTLNLYAPKSVEKFYVKYYQEDHSLIEEHTYEQLENIQVEVNNQNPKNYYTISYDQKETPINTIKIYALQEEKNE